MARWVAIVLALGGCARDAQDGPLRLRVAVVGAMQPLRPETQHDSYGNSWATDLVFETLLSLGEDGQLMPRLADRFEAARPGRYRLRVRPGAAFSDGSPVTDADVERALLGTGVQLAREGDWLVLTASPGGAPIEVVLVRNLVSHGGDKPVGTGPFAVADQTPQLLRLRRLHKANRKAEVVEFVSYDAQATAFAKTLAGEAEVLPAVPARMTEFFDGVERLRAIRGGAQQAMGVYMSARTLDRVTRRALVHGLARSDLTEVAQVTGCVPIKSSPAPDEALPGVEPIDAVAFRDDPASERLALGLRRWLATRAGRLQLLSLPSLLDEFKRGEAHLIVGQALLFPHAAHLESLKAGPSSYGGYPNHAFEGALREADLAKADAILADDPAFVPLCLRERIAVVDARFKNARVGPYGLLETLPDWEIAQ